MSPQFKCASTALILLLLIAPAFGQTFSSTVRGVVTDPSGSAVVGATIEIKNMGTNDVRRETSAADGGYEFATLQPGTYELTAQAAGFKQFVRSNVVLQAGVSASLDIKLEIGATSERVEVNAQAVLLDTESADHTAILASNLVAQLPTSTRSPLNFVFAVAGTTEAQGGMTSSSSTVDQMFNMFGLQGGRSGNTAILIDGAPATAVDWGGLMVSPNVDAVQEMQIVRNTYDVQYGKSAGGVISLVSKGGSNQFHGSAYEYFRNDNLDANSWLGNRSGWSRGEFKQNQFGGTVSGPIWNRKNLFFFADYEGLRQPATRDSGYMTIPTALERSGDFSKSFNADGTPVKIYDPFSTRKVTAADGSTYYTRDIFPDAKIPESMMDKVGKNFANLYPNPTRIGVGNALVDNFFAQAAQRTTNDKVEGRVDWASGDKNRIFGRWSQRLRQKWNPGCYFCNGSDSLYSTDNPGWHSTISDTFTPSPTLVINALVGLSRWQEGQQPIGYGIANPASVGLDPALFQVQTLPWVDVGGYASFDNNSYGLRRLVRYAHTAEVNVTKELSKHSLKFGGNFEVDLMNNRDSVSGQFSFGSGMTSCDPRDDGGLCQAGLGSITSGNGLASMLLGTGGTGGNGIPTRVEKAMSLHYYGVYFQDSWKVNRRLTLNLGMRYENQRPATERFDRLAVFDTNVKSPVQDMIHWDRPINGGYIYKSSSNRYAWDPDNKNFAPRVGIAYKLTDRIVARSGFGMFYGPASAMISYDDPGQFPGYGTVSYWTGTVDGLGYTPSTLFSNPLPGGLQKPTGNSEGLMTMVGNWISQAWPNAPHPTPVKYHFSTDLQWEINPGAVLEVGYTGWRGRKFLYGEGMSANQLPPQYIGLGDQLYQEVENPFAGVLPSWSGLGGNTIALNKLLRPFPQFGDVGWTRSLPGATANFNALNVKFNYAFRNGLSLLSTYQYSKTMDNGSEDFIGLVMGSSWRDQTRTNLDYSISAHDMPHSFVTALVYELPVGRSRKFANSISPVADAVIGGWQVSSVIRLNSGLPLFPVTMRGWYPLNDFGYPGVRANLVGDPKSTHRTTEQWFNPAAFAYAGDWTIGNSPRYLDSMRESPNRNVDLALAKNFKAEAFKIQFRAELLNAFNTPQFGGGNQWGAGINTCIECGGIPGEVNATRNSPRNIQLGLRIEY